MHEVSPCMLEDGANGCLQEPACKHVLGGDVHLHNECEVVLQRCDVYVRVGQDVVHGFFAFLLLCAFLYGLHLGFEVFLKRQGQAGDIHASLGPLSARRAAHIRQEKMQEEGAGIESMLAGQCGCIIGMCLAWM